jgi:hypothetical protein
MKLLSVVLLSCCAVMAPGSNAQDAMGLCGLNDSECFEAQILRQCRDRSNATVQSCTAWIQSIQPRVRAGDRVARDYIASAHSQIALFLPADAEEKLRHRNSARAIYAELVEQDARDVDALLGMSSVAKDLNERIDLLRRIVSIAPGSPTVPFLADALANRGGANDALEAAEVLDANYRLLPKGSGWAIAARAVALYERAGVPDRSRFLRDRMREELGAASLVSELQRIPETTSVRAGQILQKLCDTSAVAVLGASVCLEGLSEMSRILTRLPGRVDAPGFAEILAGRIRVIGTVAGWDPLTRDANWQRTISSIFLAMEAANIESPVILVTRARLSEWDPVQRLRLVDRAAQLAAPDDGPTLQLLADEYILLRRPTDALALLRMRRQLPTTTESQREYIDRNIGALERIEQASRESGVR